VIFIKWLILRYLIAYGLLRQLAKSHRWPICRRVNRSSGGVVRVTTIGNRARRRARWQLLARKKSGQPPPPLLVVYLAANFGRCCIAADRYDENDLPGLAIA
jgi:hypothetical protein